MNDMEAVFRVHADLPRQGPGLPDDVHWALAGSGLTGAIDLCDAGCGPGADLETLAEALPEARLTGIDAHAPFVQAAAARTARFGGRVRAVTGDMAAPGGPYDLIWSAGAIYFLGVTEGLTAWRGALKSGGWVAFSVPVLLDPPRPAAVAEFWAQYPAITGRAGLHERVARAGYRVVGERMIVGDAWAAYFLPLAERIAALRAGADPALGAALDDAAREIALWQKAQDHIAYLLVLARPAS